MKIPMRLFMFIFKVAYTLQFGIFEFYVKSYSSEFAMSVKFFNWIESFFKIRLALNGYNLLIA